MGSESAGGTRLVQTGRFYDSTQAHIARGHLETAGIPCCVFDHYHNTTAWDHNIALGGIRLMVHAQNYSRARAIVETIFETERATTARELIRWPLIPTIIGTLIGIWVGAPSIWRTKRKNDD